MTALYHDPENIAHAHPGHPEHPGRYTAVAEALAAEGLLARLAVVAPRLAAPEEILAVHDQRMLDRIADVTAQGGGWLDPDTYCTGRSWELARKAAGGISDLCAAVARGEHANGLALPRPPGHHATARASMGFCLINQVAVAARALQSAGLAAKIAILDFDVHHGNGTEDIFVSDPTVFFASSHQFPHYPGTGRAADQGQGAGLGLTLNVPLPPGTGDEDFLAAWSATILPATVRFDPDFLLISAGFDGHALDHLAMLEVSTAAYMELTAAILETARQVCYGKVVFALEGGYNLEALAECVTGTARLLLEAGT
jgi:acetoin utilization deacetylase AcuC-like enzyme